MMFPQSRAKAIALLICMGLASSHGALAQNPRSTRRAGAPGTVSRIEWSADGKSLSYLSEGKRYKFDLATATRAEEKKGEEAKAAPRRRSGGNPSDRAGTGKYVGRPTRGRQYTQVNSPDGKWEAHYENWNVVLKNVSSGKKVAVTTEGNEVVHYGTASWVYGEELNQTRAMWWTPDSQKLLFYRFDDEGVKPFHLVTSWSKINTEHYPEAYPKTGAKNPAAALLVYDLASGETLPIQAGGGSEEYIYGVRVSPGGDVMMVNWTDRLQHDLKVLGIELDTGECYEIVTEHQDTWQNNSPSMRFLEDQQRFLWPTEKSGYTHYELRDLDGDFHHALTSGNFQTTGIRFVDEEAGLVGFTANSSPANPYYDQYHIVGLDGKGQRRVTSLDLHHLNYSLSPDKKWLVAQYEAVDTPPCTALYSTAGKLVGHLAQSDPDSAAHVAEMFSFKSDDGRFDIYGVLYKPKDFDEKQSYPLINALYGGPGTREISPRYVSRVRSECNRGYLVVKVGNRGTGGRGKAFLGAAYLRLGDVDIQDHADAVRLLSQRSYIDGERVGIVGHSYGGYMAALGIFKHPDVYAAACLRAAVTDWRNYDTIYTERYMSTPQLNKKGYDAGAAMTYVKNFKGKALILHGMVDDNVHPTNAFQLIAALDKAGKSYESRFWPNGGHGLGSGVENTQWEFFNRILKPSRP